MPTAKKVLKKTIKVDLEGKWTLLEKGPTGWTRYRLPMDGNVATEVEPGTYKAVVIDKAGNSHIQNSFTTTRRRRAFTIEGFVNEFQREGLRFI